MLPTNNVYSIGNDVIRAKNPKITFGEGISIGNYQTNVYILGCA